MIKKFFKYIILIFCIFTFTACNNDVAVEKKKEVKGAENIKPAIELLNTLQTQILTYYKDNISFPASLNVLSSDLQNKGFLVSAKAAVKQDDSLKVILENRQFPLNVSITARDSEKDLLWKIQYRLILDKKNNLSEGEKYFYILSKKPEVVLLLDETAKNLQWKQVESGTFLIK